MLEILLRHTGRVLADNQIAYLFKVPEEMTATPCDFFGYTRDARAILIEAKEVSSRPSLPIGCEPGLTKTQWNALCDANRANCISLICWVYKGVLATISCDMAIELSRGRKSIPWGKIPDEFKHQNPKPSECLTLLEPFVRASA